MIPYDETMRYLPTIMRRLRLRAGHKTQTSALRAIRRNTGVRITAARICEWESGRTAPSLRSLFAFLFGLGYDLKVLQDEVERLIESDTPLPPAPVKENRRQRTARRLAEIRAEQRRLEEAHRLHHGSKPDAS